jgi:hypothetical protein
MRFMVPDCEHSVEPFDVALRDVLLCVVIHIVQQRTKRSRLSQLSI